MLNYNIRLSSGTNASSQGLAKNSRRSDQSNYGRTSRVSVPSIGPRNIASSCQQTMVAESFESTASLKIDDRVGVLYVSLRNPVGEIACELDDEEIFVFRDNASDRIVAFTVPNYNSYWVSRQAELIAHLEGYDAGFRRILGSLFLRTKTNISSR